jgi:hypothetical protein
MDYQKQGEDFLKQTGVKMSVKFLENGPYFDDDKANRDIYRVTFSRSGKRFSFRFGQSLRDSTGIGGTPPTAYDVLSCIEKHDYGTFGDFCMDCGYDQDSRKALKTYRAVLKQWKQVEAFFTSKELEALQEIQ